MAKTHIILPDSHAVPGESNRRYEWFAKLVNDIRTEGDEVTVIDIGDWWSMDSLCSYDKGTKGFEGRRYKADIEVGLDAQERVYKITRSVKKKLPRFVRTIGNHEQRIVKAVDRDPVLEGTIGLDDLQSKEYGWEQHDFLDSVTIDGVTYSHYFVAGISGRPIGGERHAQSLLSKNFASSTCGHSHLFDHTVRTDISGRRMHGLVVGVYQEHHSAFAGPANALWDAGVCICRGVENGNYDLERISMKRIREAYGRG